MISIALSKGRILDETLPLLKAAGIVASEDPGASRRLIIATSSAGVRLIIVRATDVPTYVQYGAADLGVAGGDVLAEHGGNGLYQPLDLGIARCRLVVAVRRGFDYEQAVRQGARLRVATKYPQVAREHFAAKGVHVDLINLYGSMELAAVRSNTLTPRPSTTLASPRASRAGCSAAQCGVKEAPRQPSTSILSAASPGSSQAPSASVRPRS